MVGDDVGVHGDPVRGAVRVLDAVGHAEEHLSEPLSGGLIRVSGDGGADGRIVVFYLAALELADQPAEHESGEVIAVERGVGAAEHRAPAVPEYEEREVGVGHVRDVVQVFFVPQIGHVAAGVRVAEGAAVEAGLAVADVVVGVDDEARSLELAYHVQVAARMLAEAVNELYHGARLAERGVRPCLDGVPAVGGREVDFSNGHCCSSLL